MSKINNKNKKILKKLYKLARETKVINNDKINFYDVDYLYDDIENQFEPNFGQLGGSNYYFYLNGGNMTLEQAFYDSFRRQYNLKN